MRKLLFIINNLNFGGAERLVIDIANGLDRKKYKPIVLLLTNKTDLVGELKADYLIFEKDFTSLKQFIKLVQALKIVRRLNPDLIHSNLNISDWLCGYLKFFFPKYKIICTIHGYDTRPLHKIRFYHKMSFCLYGFFYRSFENIICVSEDLAKNVRNEFSIREEKINVIYNGTKMPTKMRSTDSFSPTFSGKLLFVGRLVAIKNIPFLFKALLVLPDYYKLTIVGDGELRDNLQKRVTDMRLSDRVKFKGFMISVDQELLTHDILVIPSLHETFSLTALQGFLAGTPTLCSDVGGMREVVGEHFPELLFNPNSVDNLVKKILWIENNLHDIRRKILQYQSFYRSFSLDKTIQNYSRLYENVLTNR